MPFVKAAKGVDQETGLPSREPVWPSVCQGQREVWRVVTHRSNGRLEHRMMDPRDMKKAMISERLRVLGTRQKYSNHDLVFYGLDGEFNASGTRLVNTFLKDPEPTVPEFICCGDVYEVRDDMMFWTVSLPEDAVTFLKADSYWNCMTRNGVVVFFATGRGKADISFQHEGDRKAFGQAYKAWASREKKAA